MKSLFGSLLTAAALTVFAAEQANITATPDKASREYAPGEEIAVKVEFSGPGEVLWELRADGQPVRKGRLEEASPCELKFNVPVPGSALLICSLYDREKRQVSARSQTGFLIGRDEIKPAGTEPADFDAFWDGVKKELAGTPLKVLSYRNLPPPDYKPHAENGDWYDLRLSMPGKIPPVSGVLMVPKNSGMKKHPAWLYLPGAGVSSARKLYQKDTLVLDINIHGIDNFQPAEYYSNLRTGALAGYWERNADDRDTFYYKNVVMSVLRAVQYLKSRPDFDGKHIFVSSSSQGGGLALIAAGLDPDITYCGATVPALCDHAGSLAGRKPGWPGLVPVDSSNPKKDAILKASAYYDAAFHARRIKCDTYIAAGFLDPLCSAASVMAAYNSLPESTPKTLYLGINEGHNPINEQEAGRTSVLLLNAVQQDRE